MNLTNESLGHFLHCLRKVAQIPDGETIFNSLQEFTQTSGEPAIADFTKRIKRSSAEDRIEICRSLSDSQIASKLRLIDEWSRHLNLNDATVTILAGWTGLMANLLLLRMPKQVARVKSIDLSPNATRISQYLNKYYELNGARFSAETRDVQNLIDVDYSDTDVVINTSCEHFSSTSAWRSQIPKGKRIVVQSNNFFACREHVNCCASLDEFKNQMELSEIHYAGTFPLPKYERFMLIGRA